MEGGWNRGRREEQRRQPPPQGSGTRGVESGRINFNDNEFPPLPAPTQGRRARPEQFAPPPLVQPGLAIPGTSASISTGSSVEKENSENLKTLKPMRRPDAGERNRCKKVDLFANHFKVKFQPTQQIFHYDVKITRQSVKNNASKRGGKQKGGRGASTEEVQDIATTVSRADAEEIKNKLFADIHVDFPNAKPIYDGKKNLYSAIELQEGEFTVKLPAKGEGSDVTEYKVSLTLAKTLDGHGLADFLNRNTGNHVTLQQEMLQALDLVVREHPSSTRMIMGRTVYDKDINEQMDLTSDIVAARGFSMSLRPTAQGLSLNVDFSVAAFNFNATIGVLDYLRENLQIDCQPNRGLDEKYRTAAESALKGLKVAVRHRATKQKYTVWRLTEETTGQLKFNIEENGQQRRSISLVNYYWEHYGKKIEYQRLPCLDLSQQYDKPNYVPMEFCEICEGQRFLKDNLNAIQQRKMRDMACPQVGVRQERIEKMMRRQDGPTGGPYLPHFQIAVVAEMTRVTARVLDAPELRLGDRGQLRRIIPRPHDRKWNLLKSHVFDGKYIERWGIIHFANQETGEQTRMVVNNFCIAMVERFNTLGINMHTEPMINESDEMAKFDNVAQLKQTLTEIYTITQGKLQILICIMEEKHAGYESLKLICETEIGLVTQCCLWDNVIRYGDTKFSSPYLANFALKVNAKVGGSNVALDPDTTKIPRFGNSHDVVYFGADVNHPGKRDEISPSIAALVMSINPPESNRYVATMRCQKNRQEHISELGDMSKELLTKYVDKNKKLPERILFFRDGVSEGQFDMVLNDELAAMRDAYMQFEGAAEPIISCIVVQKRHHTRLFDVKSGSVRNVTPGTVVDTTIVHPREFDFYLCSHYALQGTSKPTHYHVLSDGNEFTSDELQTLINNLCYTFARCTKPVSLVPPVYYAHLAAYRGRVYLEASSSSSSPPTSIPKIRDGVENSMFFI
ncbi:hypothetical protein SUGI_1193800 [Cryptomeria japonica]|nr:hypothetical protein SUGI_1193800 [Cryptomeria japonica]